MRMRMDVTLSGFGMSAKFCSSLSFLLSLKEFTLTSSSIFHLGKSRSWRFTNCFYKGELQENASPRSQSWPRFRKNDIKRNDHPVLPHTQGRLQHFASSTRRILATSLDLTLNLPPPGAPRGGEMQSPRKKKRGAGAGQVASSV